MHFHWPDDIIESGRESHENFRHIQGQVDGSLYCDDQATLEARDISSHDVGLKGTWVYITHIQLCRISVSEKIVWIYTAVSLKIFGT